MVDAIASTLTAYLGQAKTDTVKGQLRTQPYRDVRLVALRAGTGAVAALKRRDVALAQTSAARA